MAFVNQTWVIKTIYMSIVFRLYFYPTVRLSILFCGYYNKVIYQIYDGLILSISRQTSPPVHFHALSLSHFVAQLFSNFIDALLYQFLTKFMGFVK